LQRHAVRRSPQKLVFVDDFKIKPLAAKATIKGWFRLRHTNMTAAAWTLKMSMRASRCSIVCFFLCSCL
jgi:hypothetical protein